MWPVDTIPSYLDDDWNPQSEVICHGAGFIVRRMRDRRWMVLVVCAASAIILPCSLYWPTSRPDEKQVAAAEDEVYDAVVRDMAAPIHGQDRISQLVFDDAVLTDLKNGADIKSCKETARESLRLESSKLPYNSFADKIYRVLAHPEYDDDGYLRDDTVRDFLEESCKAGHLSRTFHTDLPRTFIAPESVHFKDWLNADNGTAPFEQLFPGASGIISFSHVGFDPTLNEAIVSTSFACGGFCGAGSIYVLRKKGGRWQILNKWTTWTA